MDLSGAMPSGSGANTSTAGQPTSDTSGSAHAGGALSDAVSKEVGATKAEKQDTAPDTETVTQAKRTYKYKKLTDKGDYADEDWDEDRVKAFLSDDYEDEYTIDGQKMKLPRHIARKYVQLD